MKGSSLVLSSIFLLMHAVGADEGFVAESVISEEALLPADEQLPAVPAAEFSKAVKAVLAKPAAHEEKASEPATAKAQEIEKKASERTAVIQEQTPAIAVEEFEDKVKQDATTEYIKIEHITTRMFEVAGEFLYLQANEEGLEYATSDTSPSMDIIPTDGVKGKVFRINPKFHPGFRLGAAYFFPKSKGCLTAKWMQYTGTRRNHAFQTLGPDEGLWPDWLDMSSAPLSQKAQAQWKLAMNVFDLQVGTWFFQKKILSLKPFAGFRGAWINQSMNVNYIDVMFVEGGSTTTPQLSSTNRSDYSGYGICAGLDSKWKIWQGISFFANGDVSLLWSRFDIYKKSTLIDGTIRDRLTDRIHTTIPVFELMAGFAYEYNWKSVGLGLHVGWEEQIWVHQNMLDRFIDSFSHGTTMTVNGNLSLSGWNFRASLSF